MVNFEGIINVFVASFKGLVKYAAEGDLFCLGQPIIRTKKTT